MGTLGKNVLNPGFYLDFCTCIDPVRTTASYFKLLLCINTVNAVVFNQREIIIIIIRRRRRRINQISLLANVMYLSSSDLKVTSATKQQLLKVCHVRHRLRISLFRRFYVLFS